MDKLRAIQYFNSAVQAGTFAAAARSLDVSTPAVSQLIGALERSLGTALFHRTSGGLALTIDGERYYAVTRIVSASLGEVERDFGVRRGKPRGTLAVGMRSAVGQTCVMPRIGRFLERYPDIELVIRLIESVEDIDRADIDLAVMIGWPPDRGFVVRPLAQTRNVVCAPRPTGAGRGCPPIPTTCAPTTASSTEAPAARSSTAGPSRRGKSAGPSTCAPASSANTAPGSTRRPARERA